MLRHILHLDRVAQVRLVRAVFGDRFAVGNALERIGVDALAFAELLEHAVHHRLYGGEDVLLGDEAHLDVELVELEAAVGAQVLIAEAGGDLEVAVEARHHQQLLELLGRLRQRIELLGMQAAGHQEVARAFGRRGRQDRRLILQETLLEHAIADRLDHARTQHDVLVQGLATQVEIAVLEPDFLGILRLAEDWQRQFGGFRQHLDRLNPHLDFSGGQVGVDGRAFAQHHLAVDTDHALGAHPLHPLEARRLRVQHQLGQAVVVAQVDEQQTAVVPLPVHPAGQADRGAGVGSAKRAAGVRAIGVHEDRLVGPQGRRNGTA